MRRKRARRTVSVFSAHSFVSVPISTAGPQGSAGHHELRLHVLFWCCVWVLFKKEGILVLTVTDRPCCLRKHNYTSDWAPYCSQMSPYGASNGHTVTAEVWLKRQLVSLLAAIKHFTVRQHSGHCAGPHYARSSTFNVRI